MQPWPAFFLSHFERDVASYFILHKCLSLFAVFRSDWAVARGRDIPTEPSSTNALLACFAPATRRYELANPCARLKLRERDDSDLFGPRQLAELFEVLAGTIACQHNPVEILLTRQVDRSRPQGQGSPEHLRVL